MLNIAPLLQAQVKHSCQFAWQQTAITLFSLSQGGQMSQDLIQRGLIDGNYFPSKTCQTLSKAPDVSG